MIATDLVAAGAAMSADELAAAESVIARGLKTFVEVGEALLSIRDGHGYRFSHGTFEDYCRERWSISRPRAYELMNAAKVVGVLSGMPDIQAPRNERQANELVPLLSEPATLAAVWQEVNAGTDKVTAARVAEVVERRLNPGVFSSDTHEWYTPLEIVARVQRMLGGIDLDPCADPNRSIPAAEHFTATDDGLMREWSGRVYMNPPYGDVIGQWVGYLAKQVFTSRVTEAIALVPARTDTAWFQVLWQEAAICFLRGRLHFSGSDTGAPFPSAAAYFGPRRAEFSAEFSPIGPVVARL